MTKFRVDVSKRNGDYHSKPFPTLAGARDFFELHKTSLVDLAQLKEWQSDYREPGWKVAGAWVCIDEFHHEHTGGVVR